MSAPDGPWLVVGLGNPGAQYAGNRHNVGVMTVERLTADLGGRLGAHKTRSQVAELRLPPVHGPDGARPGARVVVARPTSYMNESGGPVAALVRFFAVSPDRLLVVHDELDLPFGQVRLKRDGGEGGHNGLRSISRVLGTKDYCRLRLGIGRPPGRMDPADFVLRDFASAEREEAAIMVGEAADAALDVVRLGWERAQAEVNTRAHQR